MPKMPENAEKFICENCDFSCSKYSNYTTHLLTAKHNFLNTLEQKNAAYKYNCKYCEKVYKARNSLWYHENKCEKKQETKTIEILGDDQKLVDLILDVVKSNSELQKQNQEFQQQVLDMCKNGIQSNITNNSVNQVNSHNKTFNLNVFLNEQCKNAMNIMEFVDTIKLDLSDAESVRKLGYVNGISNIIIKHLKALDVHMRPVHCTDLKRETVYVKYQDVWEKEGDDNKLMRKAIKHVAVKNYNAADIFKELHPDCMNWDSKHGDHFALLRIEALGGKGNNDIYDSHTKIIKKIAKEITIDKTVS
jgi:hypothetical protein